MDSFQSKPLQKEKHKLCTAIANALASGGVSPFSRTSHLSHMTSVTSMLCFVLMRGLLHAPVPRLDLGVLHHVIKRQRAALHHSQDTKHCLHNTKDDA